MTKSTRKVFAWFALGTLLFLQLAVSAHACVIPTLGKMVLSSPADMRPHEPCERSDHPLSKHCEQHCLQFSQSVDTQPHSAPISPLLPLIGVVGQHAGDPPARRDAHRARLATVVDPPPLVRFGVLRI
jgi:hypothetical protein